MKIRYRLIRRGPTARGRRYEGGKARDRGQEGDFISTKKATSVLGFVNAIRRFPPRPFNPAGTGSNPTTNECLY
jgi:hypothetical protein